jgi:hypothetical protein
MIGETPASYCDRGRRPTTGAYDAGPADGADVREGAGHGRGLLRL